MLNSQIHMYSIDTGHFYGNREKYLHDKIFIYRKEQGELHDRLLKAGKASDSEEPGRLKELLKHKSKKIKETKEKLLSLLSHKAAHNERTGGRDHIRTVRENSLNDSHIVSVFSSTLTRTIGIEEDELTDALIIVQVYYFDIFKDIAYYGFLYKGEKYIYFTSSAGQIRKKKAVFIKEEIWKKIEKTLMCGLTTEKINAKGGNNVNKQLAYMALSNSATDEWKEFDIDRTIVIDDFETEVYGTIDFVDEQTYSITRKKDFVPIPHTDGAGMVLPGVFPRNFMFRAPWIKGLLGVFDFKKFIAVHGCSPIITDIYGTVHNIIEEDIRIIFTKSQFKMYKYYDSWEEYKTCFKKHHCSAGRCNIEETRFKNARINYQMLQTLTDITDEEIDLLAEGSAKKISNICTSKDTMLEVLGVTPYNSAMTPFQQALRLYPALLNDTYAKDVLRDVKNSLLKKYRSGKLEILGKYTFLLPDFYAACEYWFCHIQKPKGLLDDGEVYCRLFKQYDTLDCLRSPHLYREHAIRNNIAACRERTEKIAEWFTTNGLYTSTHDLISKLLQFDVDGDMSLVVADRDFIRIAERNMTDIVPLYYNMRNAAPTELNKRTVYEGLHKAFTGGNIGMYSNDIAKLWNHDVFISGTKKERQEVINIIKLLCMENNFCIDAAKTLYMPKRPEWFKPLVSKYTGTGLPAFFAYAKDKDGAQTAPRNGSLVNKIYDRIPDKPIRTAGLKLDSLNFQMLMGNENTRCSPEVAKLYDRLNRQYRYMIHMKDEYADNMSYVAGRIREEFAGTGYSEETVADMLTEYLYGKKKRYKQLLWFCYGQYIVNNLKKNISPKDTRFIQCIDCGEWFETVIKDTGSCRCKGCNALHKKLLRAEQNRRAYEKRKLSRLQKH